MKATVIIRLLEEVPDPAGSALKERLVDRGFTEVLEARIGRLLEFELEGADRDQMATRIKQACKQLLVNDVIEEYEIVSIE